MRKLDHCNIVRLRYFFYSSGEKVRPCLHGGAPHLDSTRVPACLSRDCQSFPCYPPQAFPPPPRSFLTVPHTSPLLSAERRALSKSGAGIRARDSVPSGPPFHQGQVDHPYHLCQGGQASRLLGPRPPKPGALDTPAICGVLLPPDFMLVSGGHVFPALDSITTIGRACQMQGRPT